MDPEQTHLVETAIREGDYYGMQTFDQSLLSLYEQGYVTLHDAMQVATNPHDFKLLVQARGHDVALVD
jgi:twitching motility protein PilT